MTFIVCVSLFKQPQLCSIPLIAHHPHLLPFFCITRTAHHFNSHSVCMLQNFICSISGFVYKYSRPYQFSHSSPILHEHHVSKRQNVPFFFFFFSWICYKESLSWLTGQVDSCWSYSPCNVQRENRVVCLFSKQPQGLMKVVRAQELWDFYASFKNGWN